MAPSYRQGASQCIARALPVALAQLLAVPAAHAATPATSRPSDRDDLQASTRRPSGQWSMFMNGPLRQGRTPIVGPQSSTLAWRISTETNYGGPVVGQDSTIYQGTFAGQLLALNPDGTTRWVVHVPYIVESTPAILQDGRIAFVDDGGTLYVVKPNGSPSWRYQTGTGTFGGGSPAIGRDGTIYAGIWDTVYAFRPDGSIRWTYEDVGRRILGPVTVRPDGVVYGTDGDLFALDSGGSPVWRWTAPGGNGLQGAPAVGADRTIYVNSFDPNVFAVNPDGTTKWWYEAATCCDAEAKSPAIGPDGTIYVGETLSDRGVVLALNPDGTLKWQATYGDYGYGFAIGGDGTVYFTSTSLFPGPVGVWAVNPDGTLKWQYVDVGDGYVRTPPAVGIGQRIYAGGNTGFFAIGP